MTDPSSNTDTGREKHIFGWLPFLISPFPLVALLTYDWRSIEALHVPALPSTNWVGALGDSFAYYGYTTIGLAVCATSTGSLVSQRHPGKFPNKIKPWATQNLFLSFHLILGSLVFSPLSAKI